MNIISKIKLNYYNNLFQIYLKDNKNNDFISLFKKCCLGTDQMGDLALNYIHSAIEMPEGEKIFNKNLMWINSFDLEDTTNINNFINFYLDGENYCLKTYPLFLSSQKKITNKFNQLTFEDFQKHSYYLQFLLSNFDNCSTKFINSSAAFFETSDGKMFTHPRLTSGYIYIIKDPNEIFKKLLYSLNNQADHALHKMLNFDQKPEKINQNIIIEEMQSDWATNVSSWTNENVVNTFRGLIIKYEDLMSDPQDSLSSIIFHLNEAGLNLKLDYKKIENFIQNNTLEKQHYDIDISSNSKKRLSRALLTEAKKYSYEF